LSRNYNYKCHYIGIRGLTIKTTTKTKVLVLGGKGFIGRHAVAALENQGVDIVVGSRKVNQSFPLPQLEVRFELMRKASDWQSIIKEYDVVLNCVGILRPVGSSTYDAVHHLAPAALAEACHGYGIRFVHVSALGLLSDAKSGFLVSKKAGEEAIKAISSSYIIARPSLLDGEGGYGAAWLRGVSRLPFFVVPADANGLIAGLMVTDLGEALAKLCIAADSELDLEQSREFELGGDKALAFEDYIRELRKRYTKKRALCFKIPGLLARVGAHVCDLFHATPFSFGHWELLRNNNTPNPNRLPQLLGRTPLSLVGQSKTDE